MPSFKFNLGDKVKDKITGMIGIVVCQSRWLNGCRRYAVQPEKLKDGIPAENQHLDEQQLECVKAGALKVTPQETGGPFPAPKRTSGDPRP
jgi:hypothetical protein